MKKTERFVGECSKYIDGVGWTTDIPVAQLNEKGYRKESDVAIEIIKEFTLTPRTRAMIANKYGLSKEDLGEV